MVKSLLSLLLPVLILLVIPTFAHATRLAPLNKCPGQTVAGTPEQAISAMACLTNWARKDAGRKSLKLNSSLNKSAGRKVDDIIRCNDFSHTACSKAFDFYIDKYYVKKASSWDTGENIAYGADSTPREIMSAWLKSKPHRKNILSKRFKDQGLALRTTTFQGNPNTTVWVHHFGKR